MPEFEGRYSGNEPDLEIQTTDYISRMFGLIEESDAFIIFQGGTGTLSEWATVWLMAHLQYGNHRPIILYGDFWPNFMKVVKENFYVDEKEQSLYKFANSVDEVMQALNEFEVEVAKRCS
jgi:predicted Rossmann-fold nucleotide-binding protein